MNRIIFIFFLSFFFTADVKAQTPYERLHDSQQPGVVIIKGLLTKYLLSNDPAFSWYATAHDSFKPDSMVVSKMATGAGKVQLLVFGGTWCDDSQYILPRFFKLQELSGLTDSCISFFGVDRNKQTLGGIAEALQIKNVPTFIVFSNGKEAGRIVEYGKTGKWDAELAAIVSQAAN